MFDLRQNDHRRLARRRPDRRRPGPDHGPGRRARRRAARAGRRRWPPASAHTLRLTYDARAAGLARRRQLPARPGLDGRAAARLQLRLHRPRRGPLPRGVGARQPDLGPVRAHPRAAGDGHGDRAHASITNGAVDHARRRTTGGSTFPDRFTALSTLWRCGRRTRWLAPVDAVTLPVSGTTSPSRRSSWPRNASGRPGPVSWPTSAGWLADNENQIGRYLHGDRFVAFLIQGGMEYDGGCTEPRRAPSTRRTTRGGAAASSRPARPTAGGTRRWNIYHDSGGTGAPPFDFAEPPGHAVPPQPVSRGHAERRLHGGRAVLRRASPR